MTNQSVLMRADAGGIYHLALHPEDIADTVILVGDPKRSHLVAERFDRIDLTQENREFTTITGEYAGKRLTVLSTGIGAGGVDIVINELDALVNLDHATGLPLEQTKSLNLLRFGTAGALHPDIEIGSAIVSHSAFSVDGLMHFYAEDTKEHLSDLEKALGEHFSHLSMMGGLYLADADPEWFKAFSQLGDGGITFTCNGFYAPQARALRLPIRYPDMLDHAQEFSHQQLRIANLEMETAVIYGLAHQLGHRACSVSAIVANRHHGEAGSCKQVVEGMLDRFMAVVAEELSA